MSRFQLRPAVRGVLPLSIGLCGASGSGKSFSAGRLATGIQRVVGGKIGWIDTEANRALHYAESFRFDHLPFPPPFSPDDYWDAINTCVVDGCKTIIIDSMSHEHEGPGGVLEWHQAEVERLSKAWGQPEAAVQFPAWAEPKSARRRLLNNILQVNVNLVCCFRAKRKVSMPTADQKRAGQRNPIDLGWMPIAGQEFAYELTVLGVLPPGCKGVPDWRVTDPGSEMVTKRPAQFERILTDHKQLSEDMGEAMARWAQGAVVAPTLGEDGAKLLELIGSVGTPTMLEQAVAGVEKAKADGKLSEPELSALRKAVGQANKRIKEAKQP